MDEEEQEQDLQLSQMDEDDSDSRTPESEFDTIHAWITPKVNVLNKRDKFDQKLINPVTRDLTTSFLDIDRLHLVDEHLHLWNMAYAFAKMNDVDISDFLNFISIKIAILTNSSKGADKGSLLKIIKTAWTIHEEKREERKDTVEKFEQLNDKEKKRGFL